MKKKKLRILIRTSGGRAPKKELGIGHIFRVINLAECLRDNEIFFLVEDYGGVKQFFSQKNFKNIFLMRKKGDLNYDVDKTIQLIKKINPDVTIIDKYKTRNSYLRKIRKFSKVVYISDLYNIDFPADLVVCGFIGFKNGKILNKFSTKCLVGPRYQILNKNFIKKDKSTKNYQLLATFGGFDENNLAEILLEELEKQEYKIKTKIILGPSTKKSANLKFLQKKTKDFVKIINHTSNMRKDILSAEFGLCSGGMTTYEFACMKVPFGIICQVNHQLKTADVWQQKGIAKNLGLVGKDTPQKFREFLPLIVESKYGEFRTTSIVDGLGAKRVSKEITKL